MAKLSGKELISDLTEKSGRRLLIISFMVLVIKLYEVNLKTLSVFGMSLPLELFDVVSLTLILYFTYTLFVNWLTDLASFKLWLDSNKMDSNFGTTMNLDRNWLNGGTELFTKLWALEKNKKWPVDVNELDPGIKKKFQEFELNVEFYCTRLEAVGKQFNTLSKLGHFYVWFQAFLLPIILAVSALLALYCKGSFVLPN